MTWITAGGDFDWNPYNLLVSATPRSSDRYRVPLHPLPPRVLQFLERHLRSTMEIELLLLLFRSPETFWSPAAAANVLGADERDILTHFDRFATEGLLDRGKLTDAFRFAPARPEDHETVDALATIYGERADDVLRALKAAGRTLGAMSDERGAH